MDIALDKLAPTQVYAYMLQTLVPRPIAWVLTQNPQGHFNVAPFSYFNAVCSDPPLLMISVGRKPDGQRKDTWTNIMARGHFVVHIAHRELLPSVNASAETLPAGISEVEQLRLELRPFPGSPLPRLAACRIAYACDRDEIREIGRGTQALILGRISYMYIDDSICRQDGKGRLKVDADLLDPLARLGADEYMLSGEVVSLVRPP